MVHTHQCLFPFPPFSQTSVLFGSSCQFSLVTLSLFTGLPSKITTLDTRLHQWECPPVLPQHCLPSGFLHPGPAPPPPSSSSFLSGEVCPKLGSSNNGRHRTASSSHLFTKSLFSHWGSVRPGIIGTHQE